MQDMDDKSMIEFLIQKNDDLINELSIKISENQILLEMKNILESIMKECDCGNKMTKHLLFRTLQLFRSYHILADINIKNKGIYLKYNILIKLFKSLLGPDDEENIRKMVSGFEN